MDCCCHKTKHRSDEEQKKLTHRLNRIEGQVRGLREGRWKRLLFAPTGALLSPTSSFQGESIPGICHAVALSAAKEGV